MKEEFKDFPEEMKVLKEFESCVEKVCYSYIEPTFMNLPFLTGMHDRIAEFFKGTFQLPSLYYTAVQKVISVVQRINSRENNKCRLAEPV